MPIDTELLPWILVVLHDTTQMLHEECPETGRLIYEQIEQWEQALLTQLSQIDSSITYGKFITRCRHAPSHLLLQALIAQQEALRTLSEENYWISLGGFSREDAAFWNTEGDGYWALEYGKSALASTWWPFHEQIRAWADSHATDVEQVMELAHRLLSAEAGRQEIKGVIEPVLQSLLATYQQAFRKSM